MDRAWPTRWVLSGTTTEISLNTPSAVQSGIKLINQFDVASGQRTDLMLDFDACKSIVSMGNGRYALKPVINVIPTILNGIDGFINPALLGSHVMVSAQQNGTVMRATVPNATTGHDMIPAIERRMELRASPDRVWRALTNADGDLRLVRAAHLLHATGGGRRLVRMG